MSQRHPVRPLPSAERVRDRRATWNGMDSKGKLRHRLSAQMRVMASARMTVRVRALSDCSDVGCQRSVSICSSASASRVSLGSAYVDPSNTDVRK